MKNKKVTLGLILTLASIYFTSYNGQGDVEWYNVANVIIGMLGACAGILIIIDSKQ
jgi:hypothetical protein